MGGRWLRGVSDAEKEKGVSTAIRSRLRSGPCLTEGRKTPMPLHQGIGYEWAWSGRWAKAPRRASRHRAVALLVFIVIGGAVAAQGVTDNEDEPDEYELMAEDAPLSIEARAALATMENLAGRDGVPAPDRRGVSYLYGAGRPQLVCAPLRVCIIAFEPGEVIMSDGVQIGDSTRWFLKPLIGANRQTRLIVKATDAGLRSNLAVHTDRRTYIIDLVSTRDRYIPEISFRYPEHEGLSAASWETYRLATGGDPGVMLGDELPLAVSDLDFRYEVDGCPRCSFRPERIFNDGQFTYIDLPAGYDGELPVFVGFQDGDPKAPDVLQVSWLSQQRMRVASVFGRGELRVGKNVVELRWLGA